MDDSIVVATTSQVQQDIVAWVAELLEEPDAAGGDNFFDLGGHSVLALTLINQVNEHYGVEIEIQVLFEQNLGEVAATVARHAGK